MEIEPTFFDDFHCTEKERAGARTLTAMRHGQLNQQSIQPGMCFSCTPPPGIKPGIGIGCCPVCSKLFCIQCRRSCSKCGMTICKMCTKTIYMPIGHDDLHYCVPCAPPDE